MQISNFMKIHKVGAEVFDADSQSDRQAGKRVETNSRSMQFCDSA
jgi:hypothetical protein